MSILNLRRNTRGQSVVEFTLAAPLFFAAFYATVEFSHLFYVRVTVQHALDGLLYLLGEAGVTVVRL